MFNFAAYIPTVICTVFVLIKFYVHGITVLVGGSQALFILYLQIMNKWTGNTCFFM